MLMDGVTLIGCILTAAAMYGIPEPALKAIQQVEGGTVGVAACHNRDGSCDLGPFQVNDRQWVDRLAQQLASTPKTVRAALRDDACWNAEVAAWILRHELNASGDDLSVAIGNYHSHTPS